ncbi:GerAB/ArcD/ProY family transporter [Halobacillus litoralis]|uniref:GerAB/ArcD/ProY family transporter n=1 Tax=Halobacillus litoralis TaxID=45668 RepID=UPI0013E8D09C|nr:endospore germination permease [Halobacillus litoralis]
MNNQSNPDQKLNQNQQNQNPIQTQAPTQTSQKPEQKLSRRQFFFIIIQTQIGVGVLSIPYELHKVAKQDGWISLLIAGLLLQLVLFVLWALARNYPELTLFQINEKLFSKWLGKFISFVYIIYFLGVGTLIILLFGRMISLWVLPNTPLWVLALLMIAACIYLVDGGLLIMGRVYTMFSFLLVVLILLVTYSMKEMNIIYLFPILETGWGKIFTGVNKAILSFFGFIVSLVIFPKVEGKPKDKLKTIFLAHWFVVVFYLYIVLASFTFFSTKELPLVPEPLLYMLKSFELPVIARIDLFFISIWIISVATSYATYVYMASIGLKEIFQTQQTGRFLIVFGMITFFITVYVGFDMKKLEFFNQAVIYSGYVFSITLPLLMLPLSFLFKKIKKGQN